MYGSILYIYHRTFRSNWSKFHAILKGTGFVALIALPIYGFTILDSAQLLLRGRDLAGARVHQSVDPHKARCFRAIAVAYYARNCCWKTTSALPKPFNRTGKRPPAAGR